MSQTEDPEDSGEEEEEDLASSAPPPSDPPKVKKGMHIPFGIRSVMGVFPNNKRVMNRGIYLKTVRLVCVFK